jgi:hypothetical protein
VIVKFLPRFRCVITSSEQFNENQETKEEEEEGEEEEEEEEDEGGGGGGEGKEECAFGLFDLNCEVLVVRTRE